MCLGAIYWARVGTVYFAASREDAASLGFGDAWIYEELAKPPEARAVRFVKAQAAPAVAVMRGWRDDPARCPY